MSTPSGPTLFDVFGLPRRYALDGAELEKHYRALSLKHHPDRAAGADAKARVRALEETTRLNEAYKTLKDPVRRAFYLLKLHGIDLDREDAGAQKDMPLEFLEEVMELREELEGARAAKDLAHAQRMAQAVEARRKTSLDAAAAALAELEPSADPAVLRRASHQLGRVRYFSRFLEEVEAMEEELL